MLIKCDYCGKEVNKRPSYIKNNLDKGRKNYCSNPCKKLGQFTGKLCTCGYCGKEIYRTLSQIKKSKSGLLFCSSSCSCSYNNKKLRSGENNPNWKDGETLYPKIAYNIYQKECAVCGYSNENALEVHHIDVDRTNNNEDNLIILCANCHSLVHRGSLEINEEIKNNRKLSE